MKISLRSKLTGTYIIIVLLLAILLNIFTVETIKHRLIQIQNDSMIASARLIAAEASNYLNNEAYLALLAREYGQKNNTRIVIFNANQQVIADSLQDENIIGQRLDYEELQAALNGQSKAMTHYLDDTEDWVIYASSPINSPQGIQGAILISSLANDLFELVYDVRWQVFYLSCFALLLVSIIGFILSSNLIKPIIEIAEAARRVSKGAFDQQVNIKTNDEISYLANAFNDMSAKLAKNDNNRRRFFHNASHELKTPLTSTILLTDSIVYDLENGKTPPYEFMLDVKEQLYRLQELVNKLSGLARLDDNYQEDLEKINITEVLENIITTIKPLINHKELHLKFINHLYNAPIIKGNLGQIKDALTNIVENAIKYTESGQVTIEMGNFANNQVFIRITDTGIGIPTPDLEHVFERFYRVDEARSRDKGGSGLGLSIAQEVIEGHGGQIKLRSTEGVGTVVEITLTLDTLH